MVRFCLSPPSMTCSRTCNYSTTATTAQYIQVQQGCNQHTLLACLSCKMMSLFLASSAATTAARALAAAASAWRMPSALCLLSSSSFSSAASTLAFSAWTLSRCRLLASSSASICCFRRALSASPCSCRPHCTKISPGQPAIILGLLITLTAIGFCFYSKEVSTDCCGKLLLLPSKSASGRCCGPCLPSLCLTCVAQTIPMEMALPGNCGVVPLAATGCCSLGSTCLPYVSLHGWKPCVALQGFMHLCFSLVCSFPHGSCF